MKYPLTIGALVLGGLYVLGAAAYKVANNEVCPVAVEYTFPGKDARTTARLNMETERFAHSMGYKFMNSGLDGALTIYAPTDDDRLIVNVNDTEADGIKVSFYDCRKGGNGSASGFAWLSEIGNRYR